MSPVRAGRLAIIVAALAIGLIGCGTATTNVEVTLQEWAVVPSASSVPAGIVSFEVTNDGPDDVHEFVVVRTDLAPSELPTDETGAVLEDGDRMEVIDEIEDLAVGSTETLALDLEPGRYVLICNIVEEDAGETEAHYAMGMRTAFTVGD